MLAGYRIWGVPVRESANAGFTMSWVVQSVGIMRGYGFEHHQHSERELATNQRIFMLKNSACGE
jgi:hypothetical protein